MDIFKAMHKLTKGEPTIEDNEVIINKPKAQPGDIIKGIITNVIQDDGTAKKHGFGFIASHELPYERIFFHWSGLRQDTLRFPALEKNMKVEFLLQYKEKTDKHEGGFSAIKIKVL